MEHSTILFFSLIIVSQNMEFTEVFWKYIIQQDIEFLILFTDGIFGIFVKLNSLETNFKR